MPAAFIVIGLGFGDEGKGSVVDHLVRRHGVQAVVRFNGGAQARHYVVTEGRRHGFSQFGAGTFAGAETVLSRFMLFEPLAFCREAQALSELGVPDPFARVIVSEQAPLLTPINVLANRIRELNRGESRHGSCGMGIGLTQQDVDRLGTEALTVGDCRHPAVLREKLAELHRRRVGEVAAVESDETAAEIRRLKELDLEDLASFYGEFADRLRIESDVRLTERISRHDLVFEGAQGVLLDQRLGFFPHVTRSTTTFANAETLLREAGRAGAGERIGLLRGYATRHGAGPLPTETSELQVPPCDNESNPWQGAFRTGWFDAVSARYALAAAGGVDLLGLTNLDRLAGCCALRAAVRYRPEAPFPEGEIPSAAPDLQALRQRTEALKDARLEYATLPPIAAAETAELLRYADAVGELLEHTVGLLSARPDAHKLYRPGVQRDR